MHPKTGGRSQPNPIAFQPADPPIRNDTSRNPSRKTSRATIEATPGVHMSP